MEREVRIGVFGTWRGNAYIKPLKYVEGAKVTALCDKAPARIEEAKKNCDPDVAVFSNFDDFINSGLFEAVFICNYFTEHAQYAIKAMEKGIHVFSENTAASTMALCVKLCRTVEKTCCIYMMAENYLFSRGCLEMRRVYQGGTLGKVMFAEGEYVHPMSPEENFKYSNPAVHGEYHWRKYLPVTYYCSHALGPLMYITNTMPKAVIGTAVPDTKEHIEEYNRVRTDCVGVMLLEMDNGAVFRINGSSYIAPHGNWYRVSGIKGGIETVRGNEKSVRLVYNSWNTPEGVERSQIYEAQWESDAEKADNCGHGGGDYWVVKHFVDAVRSGKPNYLNVYRATAMSAVSILGWKSVLHKSRKIRIPDFSKEKERIKWENDNDTPFPTAEAPNTIPFNSGKKPTSSKIGKN